MSAKKRAIVSTEIETRHLCKRDRFKNELNTATSSPITTGAKAYSLPGTLSPEPLPETVMKMYLK